MYRIFARRLEWDSVETVLVTGGAGFIGSHLVDALLMSGVRVICLDNFNDYYAPAIKRANVAAHASNPNFVLVDGDVRDAELVTRIFEEQSIDRVAHLAAMAGVRYSVERAPLYVEVNVQGTVNLLEAARKRGVENFVFASTSSIYGATEQIPFREEQATDSPLAPYPASKKACEVMGYAYHNLFNLNFTAVRFFTAYGPRVRPDMLCFMVMDRIERGEEIALFDAGELHRDWTYIEDIIAGVLAALDKPLGYDIINLGRGEPVRVGDFVQIGEELVGKKAILSTPDAPPTEPPITYADVSKARRLLDYAPQTSIRDGLARTWEWYQATYLPTTTE
jgi:UDP-glucuronate 4-epimerase